MITFIIGTTDILQTMENFHFFRKNKALSQCRPIIFPCNNRPLLIRCGKRTVKSRNRRKLFSPSGKVLSTFLQLTIARYILGIVLYKNKGRPFLCQFQKMLKHTFRHKFDSRNNKCFVRRSTFCNQLSIPTTGTLNESIGYVIYIISIFCNRMDCFDKLRRTFGHMVDSKK